MLCFCLCLCFFYYYYPSSILYSYSSIPYSHSSAIPLNPPIFHLFLALSSRQQSKSRFGSFFPRHFSLYFPLNIPTSSSASSSRRSPGAPVDISARVELDSGGSGIDFRPVHFSTFFPDLMCEEEAFECEKKVGILFFYLFILFFCFVV